MTDTNASLKRRIPEFDGLRAIAVLAVLCFHSKFKWAASGEYGVDVFFALSGFLITSILLSEFESRDTVNFKAFYVRRSLRLVPALVCVVAACCLVELVLGPYDNGPSIAWRSFWTLTYTSNWVWAVRGGEVLGALNAPWSLAIEEQFYLAWPILMFALFRIGLSRRQIGLFVLLLAAFSVLIEWWLQRNGASFHRIYAGTDVRVGVILLGCVLSLFLADLRRALPAKILSIVGWISLSLLLVIIATGPLLPSTHLVYLHRAIVGVLTLSLVFVSLQNNKGLLKRILSFAPLVYIGQISYGIYLWHGTANLYLARYAPATPMWSRIATGIVLAMVSYHFVELPFLKMKDRFWRSPLPARATTS